MLFIFRMDAPLMSQQTDNHHSDLIRQHVSTSQDRPRDSPAAHPGCNPSTPPPGTLHTPITSHQQCTTYPTNTLQHRSPATHISKHSNTPCHRFRHLITQHDKTRQSPGNHIHLNGSTRHWTQHTAYPLRACKAATAGNVLPSKNSRKAPPPVEM